MPDAAAYRAKWGVIIPSTNTVVEHDFARLVPHGISFHAGRALITRPEMTSDATAKALLDQMEERFDEAVEQVMTAKPDRLIVAMSAEVIRRGVSEAAEWTAALAERAGVPVTTGPDAVVAALRAVGAERIGLVTPYHAESDALTVAYLEACGFEVANIIGLQCTSATAIAETTPERFTEALRGVDGDDVDALVQVGTNLSAIRVAGEAEHWLGKPTIAMNAVTVWWALRESGFADTIDGFGTVLRDH